MNPLQTAMIAFTVAIFLALGITIWVEHSTISTLRKELQTCSEQKSAAITANNELVGSVKAQNDAVQKMREASEQRERDAKKAIETANASLRSMYLKANSILTHSVDADDCIGAKQVLTTFLGGR